MNSNTVSDDKNSLTHTHIVCAVVKSILTAKAVSRLLIKPGSTNIRTKKETERYLLKGCGLAPAAAAVDDISNSFNRDM